MAKAEKDAADTPARDLAWLLWLDALERLDTLLLEVRHSQINVIHGLRQGRLYDLLVYEEDYLWGKFRTDGRSAPQFWRTHLRGSTSLREIDHMVEAWIIPFPFFAGGRTDAENSDVDRSTEKRDPPPIISPSAERYCDAEAWKAIFGKVCDSVKDDARKGYWTADPRRLYYALSALQVLKKNILRDKLILCRWGLRAIEDSRFLPAEERDDLLGRFLLVRSAVMAQAQAHIQNLGDLKAQFESALDLGIQDHPKPMTKRRREQGLYSSYLSDRCADLGSLIEDFLNQSLAETDAKLKGKIYTHRWSHSAVSSASIMWDSAGQRSAIGTRDTDLVNTSFWMPDRPDLQPVIAHEVAHNVIHHALGDLSPYVLKRTGGAFPDLLRHMSAALDTSGLDFFSLSDPRNAHNHALRELCCDLLAATVSGPAYLFALVQEIIGSDLDSLFRSPLGRIDFDLADAWLEDGWASVTVPSFEWYHRLRVVSEWIGKLAFDDPLTLRLREGVEALCQILLQTVTRLGPASIHPHLGHWQAMSEFLMAVARNSKALTVAREWWAKRDQYVANAPFLDNEQPLVGLSLERPVACAVLPESIRHYIQGLLIDMKRRQRRPCFGSGREKTRSLDFPRYYGLHWNAASKEFPELFEHLHDVPWQAAMLRVRDFLHSKKGQAWEDVGNASCWLTDMSLDGAPGRELYQIALELFYWHQTSPADPIRTILRLWRQDGIQANLTVEELRKHVVDKATSEQTLASDAWQLRAWCTHGLSSEEEEKEKTDTLDLLGRIAATVASFGSALVNDAALEKIREMVAKIPPRGILHIHYHIPALKPLSEGARRSFFIRIQMMKLRQLRDIAKRYTIFDHDCTEVPALGILRHLEITCHQKDAIALILEGFKHTERDPPSGDDMDIVQLFQIERCAASRFGKVAEILEEGPFVAEADGHAVSYHPLMGRYDLFGISTGSLPMRPRIPHFTPIKSGEERLLPPFFIRHEFAIGFRIRDNLPLPVPDNAKRLPLAFLSVTLNVRTERLDFLCRLKQHYGQDLKEDDLVLLSEGWGDVIIALQVPVRQGQSEPEKIKERRDRLKQIFEFQSKIFSDFLVERTELILSFNSLAYVVAQEAQGPEQSEEMDLRNDMWPFSLISRVRITKAYGDGVQMTQSNDRFVAKMRKLSESCTSRQAFDVVRTPGRTDFTIYFRCAHLLRDADKRKEVMTALAEDADDILTVVSDRVAMNDHPPHSFTCKEDSKRDCGHCKSAAETGPVLPPVG